MSTTAAPFPISRSVRVGEATETLTVGGPYNLCARPNKPAWCARRIQVLVAGTLTLLKDSAGIDSAPGAVFQGLTLDADFSSVTVAGGATIFVSW